MYDVNGPFIKNERRNEEKTKASEMKEARNGNGGGQIKKQAAEIYTMTCTLQTRLYYIFTPLNIVPEDMNASIWSKVLSDRHSLTQLSQSFPHTAIRECDKKRKEKKRL